MNADTKNRLQRLRHIEEALDTEDIFVIRSALRDSQMAAIRAAAHMRKEATSSNEQQVAVEYDKAACRYAVLAELFEEVLK